MKELIKKVYLLQLTYNGITDEIYHFLSDGEKKLLIETNGKFYLKEAERRKIKVVLTGGVFDVLHIGHIITLIEAKKHGDVLVVAIAKDEHIKKKGREPIHPQEYRKIMVETLKPVDISVAGLDNPKKLIELVGPDVIVYGYDQKEFLKPEGIKIVKLSKKIDDSKFKTGRILEELGV
ncbi:FAD synthase [Candidatus Bilamarchaeum dharawalense]|uniref:FAD synthase n=1 Tax=Candidatus Bilamarchaeum dharawalense TaxID=2885759 RepID=A0A5E4LUC3_9ARCH|nr:FAD synthase [Candidatus Bilamarchaeum dharawalense]